MTRAIIGAVVTAELACLRVARGHQSGKWEKHRRNALATILLLAPLVRNVLMEGRVRQTVELIDIHGVDAILKPLELGLMPRAASATSGDR